MNLFKQKYSILFLSTIICFTAHLLDAKERDIGQWVLTFWKLNGLYYVGTIVYQKKTASGVFYHIVFEDGDLGIIPSHKVHPLSLGTGSRVLTRRHDKRMYPGVIKKIVGRAFCIHFDDGNHGWTTWSGIAVKDPLNKVMGKHNLSRPSSSDI